MRRRLASHRFRRRLLWATIAVAVPAAVVAVAVDIGNTGKSFETPLSTRPAWVYHAPKVHHLTAAERRVVFATMTKFVQTAVARKDLAGAWTLLGPQLRNGQTRQEFESGNNTVIPYHAVGIGAVDVLYAYEGDVALDVSLLGARSEDTISKTFTIELVRDARNRQRWLVDAWVPRGVSSPTASRAARTTEEPLPPIKAPVSTGFLLLPFAIVGSLLVLLAVTFGTRSLVGRRRAARRYAEELASYRSTAKPS